jgi:GT2 family glycosyltransferase
MTRTLTPTVSVVIPSFNEGEWVRRTLDAVAGSRNGKNIEILLVDDGSTDGSCCGLQSEAASIPLKILRTERLGSARARNFGARHAAGAILVFMDAHVLPDPGWLETLTDLLHDPTVGLAGLPVRDVNEPRSVGCAYTFTDENLSAGWIHRTQRDPFEVPCIIGCCFGVRREVFEDVGGFDPGHTRWGVEDLELSLRTWFMGYRCVVNPAVEVAHFFKHDKPRNFTVSWEDYDVNLLRCVFTYLNDGRRKAILSAIQTRENFNRSLARVMADYDFWQRRAELQARFVRDEEWYFTKFETEFEAFERRLSEIRSGKEGSMTEINVRRICPHCGANNVGEQSQCLLCHAPLAIQKAPAAAPQEDDATVLVSELQAAPVVMTLTILNGPQEGASFSIEDQIRLGRAPDNDIVLADDPMVSRTHALLERREEEVLVSDQESGNGTFIDGERIESPMILQPGSKLGVGGTLLLLETKNP